MQKIAEKIVSVLGFSAFAAVIIEQQVIDAVKEKQKHGSQVTREIFHLQTVPQQKPRVSRRTKSLESDNLVASVAFVETKTTDVVWDESYGSRE